MHAFDAEGDIAAGLAQFFLVAQELPAAMKYLFALDLQELWVEVALRIDRMGTNRYFIVFPLDAVEVVDAQSRV
jgi:hypothetical protein